jgi:polynucleotide 5'-kinase involved in rRNA processing
MKAALTLTKMKLVTIISDSFLVELHDTKDPNEIPYNLIEFQGKNFVINEKALNIIKSIEEDIIVVSIVGRARTGKSYLMNMLLNNMGKTGTGV